VSNLPIDQFSNYLVAPRHCRGEKEHTARRVPTKKKKPDNSMVRIK